MFTELQAAQIDKWLLNPGMYGLVIGLLFVSLVRGVECLDRRFWDATSDDFMYGVLYAIVYFPLIAIALHAANTWLDAHLPFLRMQVLSQAPGWVQFLVLVLLDDFLAYWSHRLRHEIRPLWHFHSLHHSQERLNPFTTKRFHPLENLFHKLLILMIPMAIMGGSIEMWTIYLLFDASWDYFIHSNIRLNLGPLRRVIVTPQYHRVHHSRERAHFNSNYADRLVIWDRLFGTAWQDHEIYPLTGVRDYPSVNAGHLWMPRFARQHLVDLVYPFRMIWRDVQSRRAGLIPSFWRL
jgi:sterol desaturase/sphingolipid hydroxylase (fatty acid hydroxylase superfamily)